MIDILKHTIVNVNKSITYGMKKPDKKFFGCIFESVLEYRTTVLSRLGDTKRKKAKDLLKYFSRGLGRGGMQNLSAKVCKVLVRFIWSVNSDTLFCFDGVDINKNSAKKMEGLKKVRDGSEGTFWNGFAFNAVSVYGIPFLFDRENIGEEEARDGTEEQLETVRTDEKKQKGKGKQKKGSTRFRVFSEQVEKIISIFWADHWIAADRLYDDVRKYNLLMEKKMKFVIRMKTARMVTIIAQECPRNGERARENIVSKTIRIGDIPEGRYTISFPGLSEPCFLTVVKFPKLENPIRVLSNVDDSESVKRYLKRWEIERVFKSEKQEFDLEKIGTQDIHKTDNLVALVQLCFWVSAYIHNKLNPIHEFGQEKRAVTTTLFSKHFKAHLSEKWLKANRNSIIAFIAEYMK